jgi:hypothetical protein
MSNMTDARVGEKRLGLSRETVRRLSDAEIEPIAAGRPGWVSGEYLLCHYVSGALRCG